MLAAAVVSALATAQLPRSQRETELAIEALTLAQTHLLKAAEFICIEAQEREERRAAEQRALEAELRAKQSELDAEAARLAQQHEAAEEVVKRSRYRVRLNVGGQAFETSKTTLLAEPDSMLYALVHSGAFLPDAQTGEYFIDRDPKFFGTLLNYLRDNRGDGQLNLDLEELSAQERRQLTSDIEYYQMGSLMHLLPPPPAAVEPKKLCFRGFAHWHQDGEVQSHRVQDALMRAAAESSFPGSRPATLQEYVAGVIQDLPAKNSSGEPITFHGECSDGQLGVYNSKLGISVGAPLDGTSASCALYRHRRSIICVSEADGAEMR